MFVYALLVGCIGLQEVPSGDSPGAQDEGTTIGGVALSLSSVDFGDVEVGDFAEQSVVLTNGGSGLSHVNVSVSGEGFSVDQVGFDLMKDAEEVITLTFEPEDLGDYTGKIAFTIDQSDHGQVPLTGRGIEPGTGGGDDTGGGDTDSTSGELTTDVPSLAFGTMDLGATMMKSVTVSNTGDGPLTITSATASDASFTLGGNLTPPRTLDPGEERVVEVTFSPSAEKAYSGNLVLQSDDPGAPKTTIAMTGTGENQCDVCSPRIDVNTGTSSDYEITDFFSFYGSKDTRTVTIGNDGDQDLDVSSVTVKNDFLATCGTFSLGGWKGATSVAPGRTTAFTISYTASGSCLDVSQKTIDANVIHILSNDPAEPDYIVEIGGAGL